LPGRADAKHLSGVEKSAFADLLGKAAWSRIYLNCLVQARSRV